MSAHPRKSPQCRSCKSPMKGHQLGGCAVSTIPFLKIEEEEIKLQFPSVASLLTLPPEEAARWQDYRPLYDRTYTPPWMAGPSVDPETGELIIQTPNFVDLPDESPSEPPGTPIMRFSRSVSRSFSQRAFSTSSGGYNQLDQLSRPLFVIHETNEHDINEINMRAAQIGLKTKVLSPGKSYLFFHIGARFFGRYGTGPATDTLTTTNKKWVVVSRNLDDIWFLDTSQNRVAVLVLVSISGCILAFLLCAAGTITGIVISRQLLAKS